MQEIQAKPAFTHLHVHTEYSLLDGSAKIKELIKRAKELEMKSLAITDHGVMYGCIDFYKAAKDEGINPVLGCEVYVAPNSRFDKDSSSDLNYYHLVLLAENNEGYDNLVKLVSYGFLEGFYYKPRVDLEILKKHSKGLIALSACLAGPVAKNIINVGYEKAKEIALVYEDVFGKGNFFLEMQDHGIEDQKRVNETLVRMNRETKIPLVATNDSHYIYKDDSKAHDVLLCIQTAKTINDEDRMRYEGDQFYLKSSNEMYELFKGFEEALENTNKIAERCNVDINFNELKFPKFAVPNDLDAYEYLKMLCYKGLAERYETVNDELNERLDYELNVINSMGYSDYFLIVWDFIKFAKDREIPVGPGRGSAAGSLVSYCLRITDIDPIRFDLLFERFLNPERISMPDIDTDFCYERRQEVIDYCISKYGADHVSQIITFGTMAARAVIRDVGRALAIPYAEVDKVAKMVPFELGITINRALELNQELFKLYSADDTIRTLLDMSLRLEGLPRHASTHAAGVVITGKPVMDYIPLNRNDDTITTQYTMTTLEELGILKMDFLGLRTLTVIQSAKNEIKRNSGVDIDFDKLGMEDPKVFDIISNGKTLGIFQLESSGMTQFMKELSPESIDDIVAGIALYRPGPMDFIPKYVSGRHSVEPIRYTHPTLEPILKKTYGCIVYQEQVMQIVRDLAGYSLGRADLVRRAMSKKKASVMAEERRNFVYGNGSEVPGCVERGIAEEQAEKIFDEMTDFAKYAFNKSHSVCYAVLSYQTGWLKCYYPVEFMAAIMTSVMGFTSKVTEYIDECKKMDIKLLPPDINESFSYFSVKDNQIRYGLSAIKNVGRPVIEAIVNERKNGTFKSMTEFINRVESRDLNKRSIESLIKAGAFDSLGGFRKQYMILYKPLLDGVGQNKKKNIEGQVSLFDLDKSNASTFFSDKFTVADEYQKNILLVMEREVLGIYLSGHPLDEHRDLLEKHTTAKSIDFAYDTEQSGSYNEQIDGKEVVVGGLLTDKTIKYTKNNQAMAFIKVEDLYGSVEAILFSKTYDKYMELLTLDTVVFVNGRASVSEDEDGKIIANDIKSLDMIKNGVLKEPANNGKNISNGKSPRTRKTLFIRVKSNKKANINDGVRFILEAYKGTMPVYLVDDRDSKRGMLPSMYWVNGAQNLIEDLTELLGEDSVVVMDRKVRDN